MSKMERAKQFMPFAALRGYDKMVHKKESVPMPKKELTEEEAEKLNCIVGEIKKGDMVEIEYYLTDRYVVKEGIVTAIDKTLKTITVVKTKILFDDLLNVKKMEI